MLKDRKASSNIPLVTLSKAGLAGGFSSSGTLGQAEQNAIVPFPLQKPACMPTGGAVIDIDGGQGNSRSTGSCNQAGEIPGVKPALGILS